MIYASDKFRQKFIKLSDEYKNQIISIITRYKGHSLEERSKYLVSLCGKNGNAKWSGISKTLYHLYPQKGNNTHRLFYCYATDLEREVKEKTQIEEGLVLIDYTTTKNEEYRAAKNYEKGNIKYYQVFDPPVLVKDAEVVQENVPTFWFCLTSKQDQILNAKQPLLVKGSAGAGKTLISFELFKQWIAYTEMERLLYITYTDNLLNLAKRTLTDDGLVFDDSGRFNCLKFENIYSSEGIPRVINEQEARTIINSIINKLIKSNKLPDKLIFSEYFLYSYIRGLIKGRVKKKPHTILDTNKLEEIVYGCLISSQLSSNEKSKVYRCFDEYMKHNEMTEDIYFKELKTKLLSSLHKKDKDKLSKKLDDVFHKGFRFELFNEAIVVKRKFDYLSHDEIKTELLKDKMTEKDIKTIIHISKKYSEALKSKNLFDDNDLALYLLDLDILESEKYDAIIVDEVQDLTEIQIEAIVSLTKKGTENISFFGDPNQTINPTVYDYGRFNSFVYNKTSSINREFLKETHRCGPNLLEYINHLTTLRKEFNITNEREDLEPEISAVNRIDTYWACLVEDHDMINYVLEMFLNAVDCYLIVDNNNTRVRLIKQINEISDNEYEDYAENQIITVQNAKGLESKNVIMYNLISDNIEIYNNIMNENNKVSSMTFNKLYVSCTRAQDSLIICESELDKARHIRQKLFFFNNQSMAEDIKEEDISLYLSISFDPEMFYEQALNAIDNYDYLKASKKNNIALQNILNQFDYSKKSKEEHPFGFIEDFLRSSDKYRLLLQNVNVKNKLRINEYYDLFTKLIENINIIDKFSETDTNQLSKRLELFTNSRFTRRLCDERIEFDELVLMMDEEDKMSYLKRFIHLNDFNCSEHAAGALNDISKKENIIKVLKYLFNLASFNDCSSCIPTIVSLGEEVSDKVIKETNIISDFFEKIEEEIIEMEGIIYE